MKKFVALVAVAIACSLLMCGCGGNSAESINSDGGGSEIVDNVSSGNVSDEAQNPGLTVDKSFEYNGTAYYYSPLTVRVVMDEGKTVLEPEVSDDTLVTYVYSINEYEFIGTGDEYGWGDDTVELYFVEDGVILAVKPYGELINGDSDKEAILSKYDEDNIYSAFLFESL